MKLITKLFLVSAGCLIYTSCSTKDDIYEEPKTPEINLEEYANSFSNYTTVDINITSNIKNAVFSIYLENPFKNGDFSGEPVLTAVTPIKTSLKVPKDVKTLYVMGNGAMKEFATGNINLDDVITGSRASTTSLPPPVVLAAYAKYLPLNHINVKGDDLYKCTDLVVEADNNVIFFNSKLFNIIDRLLEPKVWLYSYPTSKMNTLTTSDCTFYGVDKQGNMITVPYSGVADGTANNLLSASNDTGNKYADLGPFNKGVNLGFVIMGPWGKLQFTTPALNTRNYIGTVIHYGMNDNYTVTKKVIGGAIFSCSEDGYKFKVVGMSMYDVNSCFYNPDYNDFLFSIVTDMRTANEIITNPPTTDDDYRTEIGIIMFEDNYPDHGDFDFNDAVVQYKVKDYYNCANGKKDIWTKLLAYGCDYNNTFGFHDKSGYVPFFNNITGYVNVRNESLDFTNRPTISKTLYGDVKPYLYNGNGYIFDTNYNTGDFPYVLIIPLKSENDTDFGWCVEKNRIDAVYPFAAPRATNWYTTPTDATKTINR